MMNELESEDLICPITLQVFRDPVRAKDGHVYERQAIVTWILEHGTSPMTRQPLTLDDLQTDEQIKQLVKQRRTSTVSFHVPTQRVSIPSLSQRVTNREQNNSYLRYFSRRDHSYKCVLTVFFISFVIPLTFILAIYFGLTNSLVESIEISSLYSSDFNSTNSLNRSVSLSQYFYYELLSLNLSMNGFYGFEIESLSVNSIDGDLYLDYFNESQLLTYSYKDKNYSNTYFGLNLQANRYILMITTYFCCNPGGPFTLRITGPQNIQF